GLSGVLPNKCEGGMSRSMSAQCKASWMLSPSGGSPVLQYRITGSDGGSFLAVSGESGILIMNHRFTVVGLSGVQGE
ncbi:hypothetical protein LLF88_00935, partial [bacterium]|nr:hypothetical protein [bacterium]